MSRNHFVSGEHNFICDSCGKKLKSGEGRKRWDGFYVCQEDWEQRHPQDFVRARQDHISVPWTRPINDVFLPFTYNIPLSDDGLLITEVISTTGVYNRNIADTYNTGDVLDAITWVKTKGTTDSYTGASDAITAVVGTYKRNVPSDTMTSSDTISFLLLTPTLNGAPLNSLPLG